MENNIKLKELLKQYLTDIPDNKLGTIFKHIAQDNLDIIFSRSLLDYLSTIDDDLKDKIRELDLEFLRKDIDNIELDLLKHRFSLLNLEYSYDDDEDINDNDPLRRLFIKSYALIQKCLESHLVKEAYKIVRLMKNIKVHYIYDVEVYDECVDVSKIKFGNKREDYFNSIYDDDDDEEYFIEDDDDDDDEENEIYDEELYEEDFYDIEEYFYKLNLDFSYADLEYIELLYKVKSSSFIKGISSYIKEKDDEGDKDYSLDFKKLYSEFNQGIDEYISLLNEVLLILVKNIDDFSSFFKGIRKLEGNILPIIETAKKYPCCYKYARFLFDEKCYDLIITHMPYFVEHTGELNRYDLEEVNLIIKAASKLHRNDLILKYAPISYRLESNIEPLIYLKAIAPEEILINVNSIHPGKGYLIVKPYEASLILGHITKYALSAFEKENALGWSNSYRNAVLAILELIIYEKDDVFNDYLKRKLVNNINTFMTYVDEEYIKLYVSKIKKTNFDKTILINTIEKVMVKRIQEIVFNNCRHSYFKAALLLKELEEINDTYHLIKTDLVDLLASLKGHPAFIREYKSIDLQKRYEYE